MTDTTASNHIKFPLNLLAALIGPLIMTTPASAQETSSIEQTTVQEQATPVSANIEKSIIKFSGIVQHAQGTVERIEASKSRAPLTFQSVIYESERLQVKEDSHLKIVTRNECIAVFYGEGTVLSPKSEKTWRTNSSAVRWICPANKKETISYKNTLISIAGGEILIDQNQLVVIRGQVTASGVSSPLPERKFFLLKGRTWQPSPVEDEDYRAWKFSQERPSPSESLRLTEVKRPIKTRIIIGPAMGTGHALYDANVLNQSHLSANGAQIQMHRRLQNGSLILGLVWREQEDNSRQSAPNQPPPLGVNSSIDHLAIEGGYRFSFEKWWSPYIKAGVGYDSVKLQVARNDIGYYSRHEYEFYSLSVSGGFDVMIRPEFIRWFGLYAASQINIVQSLGRGAHRPMDYSYTSYQGMPPNEAQEPWRLTTLSAQIILGLIFQF